MNELNTFTIGLIGFVTYPISKWLMIAIWDKICADTENIKLPGLNDEE